MAMMNAQQYRDSLAKRKPLKVYLDGKLLAKPLEHPYIKTSMNAVARPRTHHSGTPRARASLSILANVPPPAMHSKSAR